MLQFDVVAHRLRYEYGVACRFESVPVATARWVSSDDPVKFDEFKRRSRVNLALDNGGALAYIAPNAANLRLAEDRWSEITFQSTRYL